MNSEKAFLHVENLVVEYTSEKKIIHAVNGVSFELERGKTLALVGETGAGKTTIAKSILGILPDHGAKVKDGSIYFDGKDLLKLKEKEMLKIRGNKIAMIFQDPMTALNPVLKIGEQIMEVIRQHNKISKKAAMEKAVDMLKLVGIRPERYYDYPHQFSGGMRQRVVIAIALACNPELLLADEPTTALDVTIQAQVLTLIKKLKQEYNTSMILITHDLGVVANISDSVAVVYAGEIIEYGSKEQIFTNARHPYTAGLFQALPDLSKTTDRLANIPGLPPDPAALPTGCRFNPRCGQTSDKCKTIAPQMMEVEPGHYCRCNCCLGKDEV